MGKKLKLFGLAVLGIILAIVYPKVKKHYDTYVKPHMHLVAKAYTVAKEFNVLGYHIPWKFILPIFALFIAYKLYKRRKRRKQEEAERLRREQRYMTEEEAPAKTTTPTIVEKKETVPLATAPPPAAPAVAPAATAKPLNPHDYTQMGNRVRSFNVWPATSSANVFDLARAGFVFTGRDDVVECFQCKGTLKQWKVDDKAIKAHKDFYPDCEFVKGIESDSNVMTRLLNLNDVNEGVGQRLKQLQAVQSKSRNDEQGKHIGELSKRLDTTERTMHLVMKQMEAVTKCLAKTLADDPALSGDKSLAEITEGLVNLKESNV